MNEASFLIERHFWDNEIELGKLMKDYIRKLRVMDLGGIKEYDAMGFMIRPITKEEI